MTIESKVCRLLTPAPVTDQEKTDNPFFNLKARLAELGYQCRPCLDSSFFISSEWMPRFCRTLADVEEVLIEVSR
jgi:hypothetical protein